MVKHHALLKSHKHYMKYAKCRDVKSPSRGTPGSAGYDFYVPNNYNPISTILPGQGINIPSGIRMNIPDQHALIAHNKSGIATKKHLIVGAHVCDSDYQGEIHLHVINIGNDPVTIEAGQKLVQFLLIPICTPELEEVPADGLFTEETARGTGGFGSTGLK